jgi:hypothetical protein
VGTLLSPPQRAELEERILAAPDPWRVAACAEYERLCAEYELVPQSSRVEVWVLGQRTLDHALTAMAPATGRRGKLRRFRSGAAVELTWGRLHRAGELALLITPDARLRAQIPMLRTAVLEQLDPDDDRLPVFLAQLDALSKQAEPLTAEQRETLVAMRRAATAALDATQRAVRSYRNLLLLSAFAIVATMAGIILVHALQPHFLSVCAIRGGGLDTNLCPNGGAKPRPLDLLEVATAGALGGALAGIFTLAGARRARSPYSLLTAQLVLKVASGAAVGFLAVLMLEKGVLAGLSVQAGSKIVAYAAFFGFAQQAFTVLVDRRAGQLADSTQPKQKGRATQKT